MIDKGSNINAPGGDYDTALQAASFCDCKEIVQLLIANGADVNDQGGQYNTALQAAAYQGHEEIVELLFEKGADVNAQGGRYNSALQLHIGIMKRLYSYCSTKVRILMLKVDIMARH